MNQWNLKSLLASGALAFVLCGAGTARAQYTVTGTTSGGGETITGNGTLGPLGPATAPVALSAGGFDNVTLSLGSIATASGQDTIAFITSHNTLLNNGTVIGATGAPDSDGLNAISFNAATLTGETIINNGSVTGGQGGGNLGSSPNGGIGIVLNAGNTMSNIVLTNAGSVTGGRLDSGIGNGGSGIEIFSGGTMDNIKVTNSGDVAEGSHGGNGGGDAAITIGSGSSMSNITVINSGNAIGGSGSNNFPGFGILINSGDTLTNVTLLNSGSVTGGSGNVTGRLGIAIEASTDMSNVTVTNTGNAAGGNGLGSPGIVSGGKGSIGIFIEAGRTMTNVSVTNSGIASGGSGSGDGQPAGPIGRSSGTGGAGIDITDGGSSGGGGMIGVSLTNNNIIAGGAGTGNGGAGNAGSPDGATGGQGGAGGVGALVQFESGVSNGVTLFNNGSIVGGTGAGNGGAGGAGDLTGSGGTGGNAGTGGIGVKFNFFPDPFPGTASGISLTNNGSITGGAGTGDGGAGGSDIISGVGGIGGNAGVGGDAVQFLFGQGGSVAGITLTNNGTITGGAGAGNGGAGGLSLIISAAGGSGGAGGNAISFILNGGTAGGISVVNNGVITGGNGTGTVGSGFFVIGSNGAGGAGIAFTSGTGGGILENASVTNFGRITGGNGNSGNGPAGIGILATTGNVTINNWGAISAGNGLSQAATSGFPAVAISVAGNNNTINLNGHSSVNGTIEGANGGVNNVLNLNFTGMSPTAIAALKAQLTAQGWPASNDFTGTFIVRGVTYFVDPLVLNLNVFSYQLQGVTPNQQAIGASLDSITTNPALGSSLGNLFNAIDLSGNVPGALAALSPQQYQAYGDLAIANTTAIVQNVDARLNNIRDGSESIDTTGVGGTSDATTTAGYSKDDSKESKQVVQTPPPEKRWGMFATGDGLFFRGSNRDLDQQSDRSNSAGTLAGVDAKIGEHVVAGALFSYNNTDATLGSSINGGHATIESYSGGIYGSYHQDGFYVNGLAAYTRNHYSSDRNILFPGFAGTASANANGNQESVNIDGGYDWHATDRLTIGPIAGLQYVHLDVNGFNEIGAGAADLNVNSEKMDSLQSRVGGRINYHLLTTSTSSFAADLHAAWQHEFLDDSRGIGASFVNSGLTPFSVQTTSPLRDAGVVGLGINFSFHERLTLFADYELLMWSSSTFEQTVNGGFKLSF